MRFTHKTWLVSTVAVGAMSAVAQTALAGGLEVREQSAFFQGTSFAGSAAGGSSLSSIFWNPAASSFVGRGVTTDSSYSLILPKTELTATGLDPDGPAGPIPTLDPALAVPGSVSQTDIGRDAVVPASYAAWRFNERTVFALSMNSPFGLTTKPDDPRWVGSFIGTSSKVFSLNVTPTVSYQITPQISIGVGPQFQYVELKKFKTFAPPPAGPGFVDLNGSDIKVGGVAGINITPFRGTSIGLGYRSRIDYDVDGSFTVNAGPSLGSTLPISTPDKVTLSLRQELGSSIRLLGTVEWTNWSLLDKSPVTLTPPVVAPVIDFGWEDGWFYSIGGEFDVSKKLTVRAGVAYEESPIQDDSARLLQVPDDNRVWASIGATYNWSDSVQINAGYSHVFVEEGNFARTPATGGPLLTGKADSSADIISVGLTMKLQPLDEPLK
jgi:long-chain fatty acid transport protein